MAFAVLMSTRTAPISRLSSMPSSTPLAPYTAEVLPLATTLWTYTFPAFSMPPLPSSSVAAWVALSSALALPTPMPTPLALKVAGSMLASTVCEPTVSTFTSAFFDSLIMLPLVTCGAVFTGRAEATPLVCRVASCTVSFAPA